MPRVIVNIFFIVAGVVIPRLSTLELTVQRHFCSILKHEYAANVSTSDGCRSLIVELRPLAQAAIPFAAYVLPRLQSLRFLSVKVTARR